MDNRNVRNAKRAIKDTVESTKDGVSEAMHRSTAEAERARRELAGDEMTASEKLGSTANEAKNRVQAQVDKTKREFRDRK